MADTNRRVLATGRRAARLVGATLALAGVMGLGLAPGGATAQIAKNVAAKSPWGPNDEIGTLNMMNDASRLDALRQVAGGKVYDLGVDLFIGMPLCCTGFGDPSFQIFMTSLSSGLVFVPSHTTR